MENEYNNLSSLLGGAIQAMATRPQKTSALTTTSAVQTPYALEDLLAMRNQIGASTARLNEALKARENFGYSLASALGAIPQQQGAGSWLSDLARGFGAGATARTNAAIDRAQKVYEAEMKDLANRAALDKAMGEKTETTQKQEMGYTPMEYGTGSTSGKSGSGQGAQQQVPVLNPAYWDQMIENFDKSRPTEASYRNQSQARRSFENSVLIAGNPDENYARNQFIAAKGREFLPMARNALKGAGQITDFEDQKYTDWLNKVKDPVDLKDTAVRIVDDIAIKNGWTKEQKAQGLNLLGLTSTPENLLEQQRKSEPERVKGILNPEEILKKYDAKRLD